MRLYDAMKYAKTGVQSDGMTEYDKMKAVSLFGGGAKTLSGEPPLFFNAPTAGFLIDWRIDGKTVNGAKVGDRTANLFTGEYIGGTVNNDTFVFNITTSGAKSAIIAVEPNTKYTIRRIDSSNRFNLGECASEPVNGTQLSRIYSGGGYEDITFTTAATTHYIVAYVSTSSERAEPRMMLNTGSTALDNEQYGYKIPVTCGGITTNVYTDSQIGDGEFVSKSTTGIQIPVTEGSNTLSVGTTVQPASVSIKY